jgi:tRNA-dihydrouridine synthase B
LLKIGKHTLKNNLILAPMAGVADIAMQDICMQKGAGATYKEMIHSNHKLWNSRKTSSRLVLNSNHINIVQIVGSDPKIMATSSKRLQDMGANIIDINFGCPAKKVCKKLAGSSLLSDLSLITNIIETVVKSVEIEVSIKIRTGINSDSIVAKEVAIIAQDLGVKAIAIHGRTKEDKFNGIAEHKTLTKVKNHVSIPVIANGDITNGEIANNILTSTKADGLMIGRGACGNPWIFDEITKKLHNIPYFLPDKNEIVKTIQEHLEKTYQLYGDFGKSIFRKHFGWYIDKQFAEIEIEKRKQIKKNFNALSSVSKQQNFISSLLDI